MVPACKSLCLICKCNTKFIVLHRSGCKLPWPWEWMSDSEFAAYNNCVECREKRNIQDDGAALVQFQGA